MNISTKKIFFYLGIILLFIIFAIINTYPLVTNIKTHQLGDGGDGGEFLWNLWWTNTSLTKIHQNPYTTNYTFYPYGAKLFLHSLNILNGIISIPLQYIFNNLILVYNIIALLNFVLAGIAMFLLCFYLTKNRLASIIGGYVFAFSPFMLAHALGHLHLITTWTVPLFILFFLKFHNKQSIKNILLSSLFLVLATFSSLYFALFLFLIVFLFEIFYILQNKFKINKKFILKLCLIFIIYFLILSPFFIGILNYVKTNQSLTKSSNYVLSADVATFLTPGNLLSFSKPFKSFNWWSRAQEISLARPENQNFLGYTILIICFIGLFLLKKKKDYKRKKYLNFWLLFLFLGILLSMGTELKFFGRIFHNIKLPYYFLYKYLPISHFSNGRYPILIFIALSVLFALAFTEILKHIKGWKKYSFFILVFLLIIGEFLMVPFIITKYNVPDFYKQLKNEKGNFAIYYMPGYNPRNIERYFISSAKHMYYQTIHHKKITTGITSKLNMDTINKIERIPISKFQDYNIKYVVCEGSINNCLDVLKYPMVYKDNMIFVFQIY